MHKVEIPDRKITKEFPSEVSEMTREQYVYFVELMLDYLDGKFGLDLFRIKLIKKLLDIRVNVRFFLLPSAEQENINGEVYRLSQLCDSFFREEIRDGKPVKVANLSFIKNLIPSVCGKYYGPQDALSDITFCEYRYANMYFRSYVQSPCDCELNHLIAVLYRPRKSFLWFRHHLPWFDGQCRKRFTAKYNPFIFKRRFEAISRLPRAVRYGIFLWYSGCEEYLVSGKPEIDGSVIDLSALYKKTAEEYSTQANIGLVGILYTLAESKVFGSIEETDGQNLYDVMARLYQVVMQQREMDEKYEQMKQRHGTGS